MTLQDDIYGLFAREHSLRFSDIEHALNVRSNHLAYYLDRMVEAGLLEKEGPRYSLTERAEQDLPGTKKTPLPIILAAVERDGKLLLHKRKERPYKDQWGFIGGRMRHAETFARCAERLVREKAGLRVAFSHVAAVLHEHVRESTTKHDFILFFVRCTYLSGEGGSWFENTKNLNLILTDKWLLENKLNSSLCVQEAVMKEHAGNIESLEITSLREDDARPRDGPRAPSHDASDNPYTAR